MLFTKDNTIVLNAQSIIFGGIESTMNRAQPGCMFLLHRSCSIVAMLSQQISGRALAYDSLGQH